MAIFILILSSQYLIVADLLSLARNYIQPNFKDMEQNLDEIINFHRRFEDRVLAHRKKCRDEDDDDDVDGEDEEDEGSD